MYHFCLPEENTVLDANPQSLPQFLLNVGTLRDFHTWHSLNLTLSTITWSLPKTILARWVLHKQPDKPENPVPGTNCWTNFWTVILPSHNNCITKAWVYLHTLTWIDFTFISSECLCSICHVTREKNPWNTDMFSTRTLLTRIPIHLCIFFNSSEPIASKTLQLGTDESDCWEWISSRWQLGTLSSTAYKWNQWMNLFWWSCRMSRTY